MTTYFIKKYDGQQVAAIPDGSLDQTSTSLYLPGKDHVDYGEAIASDLVFLLENFASPNPPTGNKILAGQLWYNTTANNLNVYTGVQWVVVEAVRYGTTNGNPNVNPVQGGSLVVGYNEGDLFWDTGNFQLWCWSLTTTPASWILVNPIAPDQVHSNMVYYSVSGQDILAMIVDGSVIAVWSSSQFSPTGTSLSSDGSTINWATLFPTIYSGLTFSSNLNTLTTGNIFPVTNDTFDIGTTELAYLGGFGSLIGQSITTGMIGGTGVIISQPGNNLSIDQNWLAGFLAANLLPENPFSAVGANGIDVANGNTVSTDIPWFTNYLQQNEALQWAGSDIGLAQVGVVTAQVNTSINSMTSVSSYDVSKNNGTNTHTNTIPKQIDNSYVIAFYSMECIPQDCRGVASIILSNPSATNSSSTVTSSNVTIGSGGYLYNTAYIGPELYSSVNSYETPRQFYTIVLIDNSNPAGSYKLNTWSAIHSGQNNYSSNSNLTMGDTTVFYMEITGGLSFFGETTIVTPTTTPLPTTPNPSATSPVFVSAGVQQLVNGNWINVTSAADGGGYSLGSVWMAGPTGSPLNVQANTIQLVTTSSPAGLLASASPTSSSFTNGSWVFEYAISPNAPVGTYTVTQNATSQITVGGSNGTGYGVQTFNVIVGAAPTTTPSPSVNLNITIPSNTMNFALSTAISSNLTSQGISWNSSTAILNVTITINSGVVVGSSSTSSSAFWCDYSSPPNSISSAIAAGTIKVKIINNGYIVGAGGNGGNGLGSGPNNSQAGNNGGTAMLVQVPITLQNNGTIGGGGGGGAAQCVDNGYRFGGAGGGGAGSVAGSGGSAEPYQYGNGWGGGNPGSAGTLTTGGAGGPAANDGQNDAGTGPGGNGGNLGQPGGSTVGMAQYGGNQSGGAAGNAIVGNSFITWISQGTVLGPKA